VAAISAIVKFEISATCVPLSNPTIQMAEDFALDGIHKLADDLDAC